MPTFSSGLLLIPQLTQRNVTVDLYFQPSVGISARKMDKLRLNIKSFREPLKRSIQQVMIPSIRQNFDSGGRPAWEPLLSNTIANKGGDDRPLIRSGALRRTMGYMNIWTIDSEKAMITDLPDRIWYGKVHQAGLGGTAEGFDDEVTKKRVNLGDDGAIPARPFVVLQREDADAIDRVFNEWLGERIALAGLGGRGRA